MTSPICLITGCRLIVPQMGAHAWGDLHMVGTSFVFNAVLENGETAWEFTKPRTGDKEISIMDGAPFFERRGVIVFDALHSVFNQAAREYVKDSIPQLKGS